MKPISKRLKRTALAIGFLALPVAPAMAQACGGDFQEFLAGVREDAVVLGADRETAERVLATASINQTVLSRDRGQSVFRQEFLEFSQRMISDYRLQQGRVNLDRYADTFALAERSFGVPAPVIAAFWALETDFGAVQGDINTVDALATLAHDCRRPALFRPQLIGAIIMAQRGMLDPETMTGAWAGEIGQVQMLPMDIIEYGKDGDGDGRVDIKGSERDAILTAADFISSLGWRNGEPWLQEVSIPQELPWERTGLTSNMTVADWANVGVTPAYGNFPSGSLPARLIMPQGRFGPAFLAYPNFDIYLEWNQSFIYTTTAAYLATRLAGAPRYNPGNPEPGLSESQMIALQERLQQMGYDVGGADGILGAGTRAAVRDVQLRLGMPADAWPTPQLLQQL